MRAEELNYELPGELIAQYPARVRSESRLLVVDRSKGELTDSVFNRIGTFLLPGDCLVLNDTKVLPARFFGRRGSGGKLEGLFVAEMEAGLWQVYLKGAGKVRVGETIYLRDRAQRDFCEAEVVARAEQGRCVLRVETGGGFEDVLEEIGFAPLPPYIKRDDEAGQAAIDRLRYQTVYAQKKGAIAAPTAGLHFTEELMDRLKRSGILFALITLHVGPGTFRPITAETVEEHEMECEWFSINAENAGIINRAKEKGGRIIAVGTTAVRALETAAVGSRVKASSGETGLFIKPGYEFRLIDAILTNFHLPRTTLLALVSAFGGLDTILGAYRHAIEQRYRFYSYGDAMLIV